MYVLRLCKCLFLIKPSIKPKPLPKFPPVIISSNRNSPSSRACAVLVSRGIIPFDSPRWFSTIQVIAVILRLTGNISTTFRKSSLSISCSLDFHKQAQSHTCLNPMPVCNKWCCRCKKRCAGRIYRTFAYGSGCGL